MTDLCVDTVTAGHVRVRIPHDLILVGGIPAIDTYEYDCTRCGRAFTTQKGVSQ